MDNITKFQHLIATPLHIVNYQVQPSWKVSIGRHHFHNIMIITDGEGTAWTEGVKTELRPGMIVYHPVEEEFGYSTSQEKCLHVMGGNFTLSSLEPAFRDATASFVTQLPLPTYFNLKHLDLFTRLFGDLSLAWGRGKNANLLRCRSLFLTILHELFMDLSSKLDNHKQFERIKHVIQYMENNYHQKLSLNQLAELAGFTPSYFGQLFRHLQGVTPIEFLNDIRIDHAIRWISLGSSFSEASARAGFQDQFYFSRVFKKKKGMSPSEYMKLEQQNMF